jgi:Fic family protein
MYQPPPFTLNSSILRLTQDISKELGLILGLKIADIPISLRKANSIKTIQASLAIEGNTLSLKQVTDILEGKRIIGPEKDILEVKNALSLYKDLIKFNPLNIKDMLLAHSILMKDLVEESGKWRSGAVGIFKGKEISHVAPPAKRVPDLMLNLFKFLTEDNNLPWLLKACIFHYELEFIHPFRDGNGRMGRLWQQLILIKEDPIFELIPVEVLIKKNQAHYYQYLEESDKLGESTPFIEFSLALILNALREYRDETPHLLPKDPTARLLYAKTRLKKGAFSRKDYIAVHPDISTATASRDLLFGVQQHILKAQGQKNQVSYLFVDQNTDP